MKSKILILLFVVFSASGTMFSQGTNASFNESVYNNAIYFTPVEICLNGSRAKAVIVNKDLRSFIKDKNIADGDDMLAFMLDKKAKKECFEIDSIELKKYSFHIITADASIDTISVNSIKTLLDKYFTVKEYQDDSYRPVKIIKRYFLNPNLSNYKKYAIISKLNDFKIPSCFNNTVMTSDSFFPQEVYDILNPRPKIKPKTK